MSESVVLARPEAVISRIKKTLSSLRNLRRTLPSLGAFGQIPPGHYYSPIPRIKDIRRDEDRIFNRALRELPGVDLNVDGQLELLGRLRVFYEEQPFSDDPQPDRRYFFKNEFYSYGDALFLYAMMRWAKPKRIIEVGSGFSSFVMLDTNKIFFGNGIRLTFIEPYPRRLRSRLQPEDSERVEIIERPVQEVELSLFSRLEGQDILFVDSSHVAKVGSDVNYILFEVVPSLAAGVLVHIHDVAYPFEYPKDWILRQGRFWNENYMLRAFLTFNTAFRICIWNQFLGAFHRDRLEEAMPLCLKNSGASLWLQRL